MKIKDKNIQDTILKCAKAEFMEKGFEGSSMRTIAERAGVTTGMLYSRFADKDEIFRALVCEGGDALYDYFVETQETFAHFSPQEQREKMHSYTGSKMGDMIDIIYRYYDCFKLIVCHSNGSSYERYIDRMIDYETDSTERFMEVLRNMGSDIRMVRRDLNHMLASALFNGIFEVVAHDLPKSDAVAYIEQICQFFNAGWDRLMGL